MTALTRADSSPSPGDLVRVRGQRWVVSTVQPLQHTLVELNSVEDGRYGERLAVVWEVELDAQVIDTGALPRPEDPGDFDPPENVAAVLDAARWTSATSADVNHLQAPFRAGISIEDYQLEPLARALLAPRVNLLLADDVGLGKTIEAGLVALELLLRHRARSILIVCPAGLVSKWRAELAEKFGLDFTVVDAAECARLRRVRGSAANPFRNHPLAIVSLPWLRTARAQRLLDEVLPAEIDPRHRTIDLLILDEAHHVAPAAPKQKYAVDSQQTKLIRRLVPHCEHRLFLTATPHNGYPESFQALLELIDDQRFARGLEPDEVAQRETVVRRLKTEVVTSDGTPFLPRTTGIIEVDYPDNERLAYELLSEFVAARRQRGSQPRRDRPHGRRVDMVTLLLKKRLYSSPAAFAVTVDVVRASASRAQSGSLPHAEIHEEWQDDERSEADWAEEAWADEFIESFDDRDALTDEDRDEQETDALRRAESTLASPRPREDGDQADTGLALLEQMRTWVAPFAHRPDAKAEALIRYLRGVCLAGVSWLNERVVVFTEYRDTQNWLEELLRAEGWTRGGRVGILHGGMDDTERETLRQQFQADPSTTPIRILLATDAASEGIDLHWHCHRVVNYDIPFNPNRLEQRIGRIDRYGQRQTPEIRHFVSAGWQQRRTGLDADLDFLTRIARRIAQVRSDLGAVNPVLGSAVLRVMLGERVNEKALDRATARPSRRLASDADVRERVARLRVQLDSTVADLQITPDRVRRLVDTGLRMARQAPLTRALDPDPVWDVPPLTGTWVRATAGLAHPLRPDELRPVTFDQKVARDRREEVVHAHLNHPLVAMSTRLLTAAAAAEAQPLSRVTLVATQRREVTEPLAVAYVRYLRIGGDAIRLHEEVLHAGGWLRPGGRFVRVENLGLLSSLASEALEEGLAAPYAVQRTIVDAWPGAERGLIGAVDWRVRTRQEAVDRALQTREAAELTRNADNFARFIANLSRRLTGPDQPLLELGEAAERSQLERDQQAMHARLAAAPREEAEEADRIRARYTNLTDHAFPIAVVVVVPETRS